MNIIAKRIDVFTEKKRFYFLLFLFYFILTIILYTDYISGDLIPLSGDGCGYLNIFYFTRQCFLEGRLPLWNSLMNAGRPFITDFTNCVFYPIRILFSFLDTKWFFYCFYSWHLAFGATTFSLYLKEVKCEKWVSIAFSLVYYFSICLGGFRKTHLLIITTTVWLPSILLFIEKFYRTKKNYYLYISSLIMAIQFMAGFPQDALYSDIIAGLYIIALEIRYKFPIIKWIRAIVAWGLFYIGFILAGIIPFAEMVLTYSKGDASGLTFEQFCSFSFEPLKLILALCPTFFGKTPGGVLGSFSLEIFLGTITLSLILYSVFRCIHNRQIAVSIGFLLGSIIYACSGEISFLAHFFYKIPVLNSFRCSHRILFVYTFFGLVIAALSLNRILEDKKELRVFVRVLIGELAILLTACLINYFFILNKVSEITFYDEINTKYLKTFIVLLVAIISGWFIYKCEKRTRWMLTICISLIVIDTFPYWRQASFYDMEKFGVDTDDERFLVEHRGEGKVLLASPYLDGGYESAISTSFALSLGIQGINSYSTINNPKLSRLLTSEEIIEPQFNFSGLYTGFPNIQSNLEQDNDILSMLGIKYIIDQEKIVQDGNELIIESEINSVKDVLFNISHIDILKSAETGIYGYEVDLLPREEYRISFDYNGPSAVSDLFYIDFCGGNDYDSPTQQKFVKLRTDKTHYEYVINSGDIPDSVKTIEARLVTLNTYNDFSVENFKVEQVECKKVINPYSIILDNKGVKIYENKNCKPLIYSNGEIVGISDADYVYGHNEDFDFDDVDYIVGHDSVKFAPAEIDNIKFDGNKASAIVNCSENSFINFSQTFYPGWHAYVDGKRVKLYEVNGYIQGCEVPKGQHQILFKYIPVSLYVGMACSFVTLAIWLFIIQRERKQKSEGI